MTIGFAGDHAGYLLADPIEKMIRERGLGFKNFGTFGPESVDYTDFAHPLAEAVAKGEVDAGIAVCGTGNGMAITLNKHHGIRAGLAWNEDIAKLVKEHNNANILVLPQRFITRETAVKCAQAWLDATFEGGRHLRRIEKMECW